MKSLRKWQGENPVVTTAAIAAHCGVTVRTVDRWKNKETRPRAEEQRKLTALTEGQVTANDFIDAHPDHEVEPARAAS